MTLQPLVRHTSCQGRDWPRDQCVTVAQVRTGHSPLVAAYLDGIECRDSAICPHCHSTDKTVEHLVFQCPAHDHARRDTWPGDTFTTDPRRLWSYLERIGAVTRPPPTGNERERELLDHQATSSVTVSRQEKKELTHQAEENIRTFLLNQFIVALLYVKHSFVHNALLLSVVFFQRHWRYCQTLTMQTI